jgi:hypothetical protein
MTKLHTERTSHTLFIRVSALSVTPSGLIKWQPLNYQARETAYTCHELRLVLRTVGRLVPSLRGNETSAYRTEARDTATRSLVGLSEYRQPPCHGPTWWPVSEWIACESGACLHESPTSLAA